MSGKPSDAQIDSEPESIEGRKRRRGAEEGRIVTNVHAAFGRYICAQADDLGISPSTVARMLLVEAMKGRGLTIAQLEAEYPAPAQPKDKRLKVTGAQPLAVTA